MPRVKFLRVKPQKFLEEIQYKTGLTFQELANICKVHRRSFSDWKHGEYLMPIFVFRKLVKISGFKSPAIKILPDYWHIKEAARKGAFARNKIYGNPGTPKGRSKGGKITIQKLHSDPEFAKKIGFLIRKKINYPQKSPKLAELVGIIIGDGGITNYQVRVTLNKETDKKYAGYIAKLFRDLFYLTPTISEEKNEETCYITVSSQNLVEYLIKLGLKKGNKVKQQIDVPTWIKRNKTLAINCLRGVFDTDGCFYIDKHYYKDKVYYNCGMCFRNCSMPVLVFFKTKLEQLGFHPTRNTKFSISLRRENEIIKYFQIVGSSNPKHLNKFKQYFKNKFGEVPKWTQRSRLESG